GRLPAAGRAGLQRSVWRRQWETTGAGTLKDILTTNNMEDCLALRRATECLYTICPSSLAADQPQTTCHAGSPVVRVEDIEPPSSRRESGRAQVGGSDFEFVNQCAY